MPSPVSPPYLAFATSRIPLILAGYVCLTLFPAHPVESWKGQAFLGNNWLDGWVRWDSMWYESIVNSHPRFLPAYLSSANFFPLYAWASWLLALPLRVFLNPKSAFYIAGLLLSSSAFLVGLIAVYRLATTLAGSDVAGRTVWLMALFPFSFFSSAVYADALYFCLAAWCLYFAHAKQWRIACALAALAAMTRIPGFALFPALILEYLRQHDFQVRSLRREVACGAILALAPAVLGTYFWMRYGDPLAFLHARQTGWHRAVGLGALTSDFDRFLSGSILACRDLGDCLKEWEPTRTILGYWYLALLPGSVVLTIYAARTLGVGLCAWALGSIMMSLPNGLDGVGRFTSVLFPVFIALGILLRRRAAFFAVCTFYVPFLLLFFGQFARWRPVL
jgi:hypothetical protein